MRICGCGCGGEVPDVAYGCRRKDGTYLTRPSSARFIRGHNMRLTHWGQNSTNYGTIHAWLRRNHPKVGICEQCGGHKPTDYALLKGRVHARSRDNYHELCRRCHVRYDEIGGRRWKVAA